MKSLLKLPFPFKIGLGVLAALLCMTDAGSTPVYYTINLRGAAPTPSPTPFISYLVLPEDPYSLSWYETVLKINLRDPCFNPPDCTLSNPYDYADFSIIYDGTPTGLTVNIGDSSTNNGGSGDAVTQSNDAEMQIGALLSDPSQFPTLRVFGNDNAPPANKERLIVPGFAGIGRNIVLSVGNQYFLYDNGVGNTGSLDVTPPPFDYLFALAGQPDSEGPINYDIYAAFNRVIDGNYRYGSGVGEVTVCLRSAGEQPCFWTAAPEPAILPIALLGLGILGFGRWRIARSASNK